MIEARALIIEAGHSLTREAMVRGYHICDLVWIESIGGGRAEGGLAGGRGLGGGGD